MSTNLNPLKLKYRLAPNPKTPPLFQSVVKNLDNQEEVLADPKAIRALVALMNQHAVIGGAACHWGGPAAFAEIMSSLHALMFRSEKGIQWYEKFNFINDAGHTENGIYALRALYGFDNLAFNDLKGFRSLESKLTGHGEAHLNPEGVFISNGPLGSGVPQAQGLAIADRLLKNDRVTLCTLSDGGAMEGETKEAFAAIPGLAQKEKLNPFVLIISDNNTKLSGRIGEDSFDMNPSFASLASLGWDLTVLQKGHDLQKVHHQIEKSIQKAIQNPTSPVALVVKTIKGKGVKSTEEAASGGHGYPLKAYDPKLPSFINEIYEGKAPEEFLSWANDIINSKPESKNVKTPAIKKEKVQPGFARAAIQATQKGLPVVSVCADLQGSTGIAAFHKEFPERKIDVGVAESNMISVGIGLSKHGFIPIVDTFSQFGITKGNLPLIMAGLSQGPVVGLFSHIGFQDAADGASHQATTYLSAVSSIPHVDTVVCSCSTEAEAYMGHVLQNFAEQRLQGQTPPSTLFFMGRENFPAHYREGLSYEYGKPQILKEGTKGLIVANGPMVPKALLAAEELAKQGQNLTVVNNPFINRPDTKLLTQLLSQNESRLITVEDHQLVGGAGAMLAHSLLLEGARFQLKSIGNHGEFGQSAYCADHLYTAKKMDEKAIVKAFFEF